MGVTVKAPKSPSTSSGWISARIVRAQAPLSFLKPAVPRVPPRNRCVLSLTHPAPHVQIALFGTTPSGEPLWQTAAACRGSRQRRWATRGYPERFSGLCAGGAGDTIPFRHAASYGTVGCGRCKTTGGEIKGRLSGLRPQHYRHRPPWEVACLSACVRKRIMMKRSSAFQKRILMSRLMHGNVPEKEKRVSTK
jgi:hypothetical protein